MPQSYDETPYADDPYPSSHPGHIAAVATLAGLTPPPVERSRVLELGCARGGNLIPMAVALQDSEFVGIDSSAGQVAAARAVVDALGLANVTIHERDILELDADLGLFDYILCHGTYSWVRRPVQDKILEISAQCLAPAGLVYISYNTYPGWRLREVVRDLMCYRTRAYDRPDERALEARRILDFVADSAALWDRPYASLLREESEYVRGRTDSYLLHDHLEDVNEPVYFHEFLARAEKDGLRFISEVQGSLIALESMPAAVATNLRQFASNDVELEQLIDYVINRKFRQSVLCRTATAAARTVSFEDLARLYVAAPRADFPRSFPLRNQRLVGAALDYLARQWPLSIRCGSLPSLAAVSKQRGSSIDAARAVNDFEDLALDLIACYKRKLVEFQTCAPAFVVDISEMPLASRLARYQARVGSIVTNLRHDAGQLNEFSRTVLCCLDGKHNRNAILRVLHQSRNQGGVVEAAIGSRPEVECRSGDEVNALEALYGLKLDRCLLKLARFALLTG